jgi:hypothetical protein
MPALRRHGMVRMLYREASEDSSSKDMPISSLNRPKSFPDVPYDVHFGTPIGLSITISIKHKFILRNAIGMKTYGYYF